MQMPAEPKPDLPLEIADLLLIDVVGYSKLLVNEQIEMLHELNRIVRGTESFRAAEASGKLNRRETEWHSFSFAAQKSPCDVLSRLAEPCKIMPISTYGWEFTVAQSTGSSM
jgi:hypothetical protein